MSMAEDARRLQQEAADKQRNERGTARGAVERWRERVQSQIPEFLDAVRSLDIAPDKKGMFGRFWVVGVPLEIAQSDSYGGPPTAPIAVSPDGTWWIVSINYTVSVGGGGPNKRQISRASQEITIDPRLQVEPEAIRAAFVSRLAQR
ncbi:hypothetical protein [Microbacterium sp. P04]|uniref:hypothetical protein n=1 Tax=Microbacterium sp. P04 TaxID=3366947 RepID=UPI0037467D55